MARRARDRALTDTENAAIAAANGDPDDSAELLSDLDRAAMERDALARQMRKQGQAPIDAELDSDDIQDDELRNLAELDSAGDVRWLITCTAPPDKAGYVGELPNGELSLAKITKLWGAGTYRIKGLRDNGQFFRQRTVKISSVTTPQAAAPAQSSSVQDVLAILAADKSKSRDDMMKWAAILVPALAPVLLKLFDRGGTSLAELTTALKNMQELNGGNKQQSSLEQMQQFVKLMELAREMMPEAEKTGSTWVDVLRDAVTSLPAVLGNRGAAPAVVRAPAPPGARPVAQSPASLAHVPNAPPQPPQVPSPTDNPQDANPMMALVHWLMARLPQLEERAAKDRDPELYADVLLDNLPENVDLREVNELLARPDWWVILKGARPGIGPYQPWFTEMHAALRLRVREALQELARENKEPAPETEIEKMTAANAGEGEV
jgi:hypothetical protein